MKKRNLLKTSALLSASTFWIKPIVRAVVLPAHAECSPTSIPSGRWLFKLKGDSITSFEIDLSPSTGNIFIHVSSGGAILIVLDTPFADTEYVVNYWDPCRSSMSGNYRVDTGPFTTAIHHGTWIGTKL